MASTSSPHPLILRSTATLFFIILNLGAAAASQWCHPQDRKALLQTKKSLNNPSILSSWTPSSDCCANWYAVACDATSHRVAALTIQNDNFPGSIPDAVGNLPYITYLILRKLPNLTGPIPNSIANLHNLEILRLDWNALTGPIPNFLHTLKKLGYINLSYNKLSGSIPASLALAPSLYFLRLDRNHLTGSIPDSFGDCAFDTLNLSHNLLSGTIPTSLGKLNCTMLHLETNNLTGDASFLFGKDKQMDQLDLSRNQLEFDMSKVEVPSRINWLILDHNKIYGSLPPSIAELPNMFTLNVSYNRLCGKIPAGGTMANFDKYSFGHNRCLCGAPLNACT